MEKNKLISLGDWSLDLNQRGRARYDHENCSGSNAEAGRISGPWDVNGRFYNTKDIDSLICAGCGLPVPEGIIITNLMEGTKV